MTLSRRHLNQALLATLAIKLLLAALIPLSGDEAYFLIWGKNLDYGFYDHPPMVGWLLWAMLQISDAEWVLRLPVVLITSFIGYGLYRLLQEWDEQKALLIALLYLVSPLNLLGVIITTDAGLVLFSFLTVATLARAMRSGVRRDFIWAGVFFGLACLSKYFAALLGLAIIAYWASTPAARARRNDFLALFAASLPFIAINVIWNMTHCWANVMFNVFNRHDHAGFGLHKPLLYLALQLYLMTPLFAWWLWQRRSTLASAWQDARFRLFGFAFLVPMAVFLPISLGKVIGWHWLLSFYPFFFALLAFWLDAATLRRGLRFMAYFGGAHVALLLALALMPMAAWQHTPWLRGAIVMFKPDAVLEPMRSYRSQYALATDGYSNAAILSYHAGENVMVFGAGSSHARHDDIITDFRALKGRDIAILLKDPPAFEKYAPYFRTTEFDEFSAYGATFYVVHGHGFDYESYRESVLRPVRDRYYAIPAYLPLAGCYFCERYFPDESCHRKARP